MGGLRNCGATLAAALAHLLADKFSLFYIELFARLINPPMKATSTQSGTLPATFFACFPELVEIGRSAHRVLLADSETGVYTRSALGESSGAG